MELYVHIPFCVRKCRYCDFLSSPADDETKIRYIRDVLKEIGYRSEGILFDTIFIGGGTPSILDPGLSAKLLEGIRSYAAPGAEWTIECNPGTLSEEKLAIYRDFGVNRLSLGLQSADDRELQVLGRIHTYEDFLRTYEMVRNTGFDNVNVDLMSGLPGQTVSSWDKTLRTVAGLGPEHISAYSLIIEPGTPFYTDTSLHLPDEEDERAMYHLTADVLAGYGLSRYEISNYSRPGCECRHNLGYWTGEEYFGVGIGAASYEKVPGLDKNDYGYRKETCQHGDRKVRSDKDISGQTGDETVYIRYNNTRDMEQYLGYLEHDDFGGLAGARTDIERIGTRERISEYMILGLRLISGISKADFKDRFGSEPEDIFGETIRKYLDAGLLLEDREGRLFLSPRGLDLSNVVMADFLP